MKANEEWRNDPERIEAAKYFRLARQDALGDALAVLEIVKRMLDRTTPEDRLPRFMDHTPESMVGAAMYRVREELKRYRDPTTECGLENAAAFGQGSTLFDRAEASWITDAEYRAKWERKKD